LRAFGFWLSLGIFGQAVALQLIEAGPFVRYQHYHPLSSLLDEDTFFLLVYFFLQTVVVAGGLKTRFPKILTWLGHNFRPWQLLGVGLIFIISSAAVSRSIALYVAELFFAVLVQAVNLGNIVLVAWSIPEKKLSWLKRRFENLLGPSDKRDLTENGGIDRYALLAAIYVTIVTTLLSIFVYERHPHIPDEVLYLFQARYFANGMLSVPPPPVPEAFSFYMIPYEAERWYSIFPPGWPAILALGVLIGMPWLINPLLSGIIIVLSYIFLQEIYSRRMARLAILMLCFSPWFVFMGMNFMAHTLALTCTLFAAVSMVRARKTGNALWGLFAGGAVGMLSLTRPLDGLVIGVLLGLWAVGASGRRLRLPAITGFVLGTLLIGALIFPYNKEVTGSSTKFPLTSYYEHYHGPKSNAIGFGPERGLGWPIDPFPGHSPVEAFINSSLNTFSVNTELFGWSMGSLLVVAIFLFSGQMRRSDYLMLTVIAAVLGTYSLYWFSGGPDFGARYWYLILIPLLALAVRGIRLLERRFKSESPASTPNGIRVTAAILCLSFFVLVNYIPWRSIDKYHHYRGMRPDIRELAKKYAFGRSLVLIRTDTGSYADYLSAWTYNPLDPDADVPVYAWDRNADVRAELLKAYPDRPVWILEGPSRSGGGFKLLGDPFSAPDLIESEDFDRSFHLKGT
jgi:hypothetical protein